MLKFIICFVTRAIYRIKIQGLENVPEKGPALLVANHMSMIDGFLVGSIIPRLVRFILWKPYYEDWRLHWLFKRMESIPISETDPPKEILRSLLVAKKALEEGDIVCIFAEGEISRTGNLLEFKRGFEVIVKGLDVPVIPIFLDRVWGSIFSFEHGKVLGKWPRQIPYPITITIGKPIPQVSGKTLQPSEVRQAVQDLGSEAFRDRLVEMKPLPVEFLRQAKRHPFLMAVADSSGRELSRAQLAVSSHVWAEHLQTLLTPQPCVGILLPPLVPTAIVNVALSLLGRIPVNLNYTAGADVLKQCIEKAGIDRILTSRKLLEKAGLEALPSMIFIEEVLEQIPRSRYLWQGLRFAMTPSRWLIHSWAAKCAKSIDEDATILFSSGSTGVPKGVELTHANILSNILGLAQIFDVSRKDKILGVLPFFHSFGFTATLWFPLVHGFGAVYHTSPLDARKIGELIEKYKATVLLSTPTFLSAYTRKCTREQFQSLRYVITGAERLSEDLAKEFEDKFGKTPMEGYGCTELSPVAAANVPDFSSGTIKQVGHKPGKIGHPIPGVSMRIVHPDTFEPLPVGQAGLLLVKGPNVMKGYLNDPEKTKEVMREGWYVTGDIASIDPNGFVQITDRLSRFSKIGGEMVPHVMIEDKLRAISGRAEPTFVVTSVPDEKKGEALVVLSAGYEGSLEELWKKLNESDMSKLWIPAKNRFFAITALPYLGTGKLDLAKVRSLAKEKTAE